MENSKEKLQSFWLKQLQQDLPQYTLADQRSIINWLLENNHFLDIYQPVRVDKIMDYQTRLDYRYSLLKERYLGFNYIDSYDSLINRLQIVAIKFSSFLSIQYCHKFHKSMFRVVKKLLEEMITYDIYLNKRFKTITLENSEQHLREALTLTTIEEYCLHSVNNKPFFLYSLRQRLLQEPLTSSEHLINLRRLNETNNFSNLMEKITIFC
ncbi:MAG: hypothetical protein QNJ64_01275 [Crocosphaera sp.]|nr:hypothetical protein [Crocosphaera sp.]